MQLGHLKIAYTFRWLYSALVLLKKVLILNGNTESLIVRKCTDFEKDHPRMDVSKPEEIQRLNKLKENIMNLYYNTGDYMYYKSFRK